MAKLLKLRRGTTSQHSSFTGAEGEVTVDTDKDVLVVHDGSTAGGHAMAAQDMDNVPAGSILGTQLENSGVTAGQYGSSSAIPIVTVDAQGLVTAASTTAIDSTTIANGTSNVAVANNGNITVTRAGSTKLNVVGGGVDVTGDITTTGNVSTGDNQYYYVGDSNDGRYYHDGNNTYLEETGQGELRLASHNGPGVRITKGASETLANFSNDGSCELYHDNTKKLNTVATGVEVTGNITSTGSLTVDQGAVIKGANDTAGILELHSDRGDDNPDKWRFIAEASGSELNIQNYANGAWQNNLRATGNAGVDLYHSNGIKASTTSGGFSVTGNIDVSGTVDGVDIQSFYNTTFALSNGSGVLSNGVTATTQAQSDNSLKVATTAYVRTAISEAQAFPSGTKMLFQQTAAPTGWTKVTSGVDNKALRVVSGTAGSGGSNAFSNTLASRSITANAANATQGGNISVANTSAGGNVSIDSASTGGTVNSHTLTINEIPSHSHSIGLNQGRGTNTNYRNNAAGLAGVSYIGANTRNYTNAGSFSTNNSGGGGGHSHGFTGGSHNHNGTLSGTAHTHNATFTGSAHNHSISVTNLDMAVQYLDVIIAAKD